MHQIHNKELFFFEQENKTVHFESQFELYFLQSLTQWNKTFITLYGKRYQYLNIL